MASNFGHYTLALLCPPLYFFVRQRWIAGTIHLVNYLLAIPMLLIFGLGMLMWAVGAFHAAWDLRGHLQEEMIQRQAEVLAERLGPETENQQGML